VSVSTPTTLEPTTTVIQLTESAALRVQRLMEEKDLQSHALRVFVSGGGCSGFQYGMAFEPDARENDVRISFESLDVVIDPMSYGYLAGATIDYVEDLMGGGFSITNPNAVSTCGCGHSFRTEGSDQPAAEDHSAGGCGCH
jgi:iron-sulfur cluster assembly accessory protein